MSTLHTRRAFLRSTALMGAAAACAPAARSPSPSATPGSVVSPSPAPDSSATRLVGDILEFTLRGPYAWNGGRVTLKLHPAFVGARKAFFVRTDTSDPDFARSEQLVYVPLLANALRATPKGVGELYLFSGGLPDQLPVLSTAPGAPDFTSLYVIHRVRFTAERTLLDSAEKVRAAERDGRVAVEATKIVVNYPVVKWPDGELPVDPKVEKALEGGPLVEKADPEKGRVTFKLHQCFPESRYIVTDTSAVPMAPMMNVAGAPATKGLAAAGATSKITVFANGLSGPGAMGAQPAIFEAKAGHPAWSPMWDHWTAVWKVPAKAVLLRTQAELDARVAAGEIELHRGTPDTKGEGFVVNCPSPLTAPNDFVVRP